ncbi:hypothetical protein MKW92_000373, partial [Papaver armeniacum]
MAEGDQKPDATTEGGVVSTVNVHLPVIASASVDPVAASASVDLSVSEGCNVGRYVLTLHPGVSFEQAIDFYTIGLGAQDLKKDIRFVQGDRGLSAVEILNTANLSLAGELLSVSEQPQVTSFA